MQTNENLLLVSAILFLDTVWIDRGQLQIQIWSSKHHITSHHISSVGKSNRQRAKVKACKANKLLNRLR